MLDYDDRAMAAQLLREHAHHHPSEAHIARRLAEGLSDREGYDYETAAVERGEALRALLDAIPEQERMRIHASLWARAEEVMEGVQV